MNGAQDLGGMMGFGPVRPEADEPPFHARWEARVFALSLAAGFAGRWNIDAGRAARESIHPAQYLSSSYYAIWLEGLTRLLVDTGLVGPDELAAGAALRPPVPGVRALCAADVPPALARGGPSERPAPGAPRFAVGDAVRARVVHPVHHTRLPRYVRGRHGTVVRRHGAHVFPDTNARFLGEQPQWLYTVRFEAAELWGPDTSAGAVHVDCWEPYLEPAGWGASTGTRA